MNHQNGNLKERPHKRGGGSDAKRLKFHSKTCVSSSFENLEYSKLDPSIPEHKRRLEQRRKMISFGKNTTGYEAYLKQVPKEKRQRRNMDTPMTPDHTLDIPNKRWLGQVRAWRRALHNYDPPDFQASLASVAKPMDTQTSGAAHEKISLSIQDRELEDAKRKGLLVDIGGGTGHDDDKNSPTSVLELDNTQQEEMKELDQWDATRGTEDFGQEEEDSDDDLL